MPILAGDRLIGRIDPRLDRERGRLVLRLLQLEPGVKLTENLRRHLRKALESFARFHRVEGIEVERTRSPSTRPWPLITTLSKGPPEAPPEPDTIKFPLSFFILSVPP